MLFNLFLVEAGSQQKRLPELALWQLKGGKEECHRQQPDGDGLQDIKEPAATAGLAAWIAVDTLLVALLGCLSFISHPIVTPSFGIKGISTVSLHKPDKPRKFGVLPLA